MPPAKILLAEDDNNLRETLAEALREQGWEVNAVANGQAAMDALDDPESAQVLVLDGLLPKVNGFDVAKYVRGRGMETPIIFMSGVFKSPDQQKEAKDKYGARQYLTKPFEPKRLVDAVKPLLFSGGGAAGAPTPQQPLPTEGTLLESPVLYLLWRAAREMHTGVLELYGETVRARVFVFKGRAVFGQHSDPQLNVGVELVRDGTLDADRYKQVCEMAVQRGAGLFDVIKGEGIASDQQLRAAYKVLLPKIIERVVAVSGRFRWVPTDQFSNIIPAVSMALIEPLLAGLRKCGERDLEPHVGPRRPLRLAPGDAWADVTPKLTEACGSESLIRAINGRANIAQMLEAAPNAAEKASRYRQVYLLMSTMSVRASLEPIPMGNAAAQSSQSNISADRVEQAAQAQAQPRPAPAPARGGFSATPSTNAASGGLPGSGPPPRGGRRP